MKHILVGIDGSEASKKAAQIALELAKSSGAKLTLMLVLEPPHVVGLSVLDAYAVTKVQMPPEAIAEAKRVLDDIARALPAQVDCVVEIGRPADTLLDKAAELRVDHLVVGARGRTAAGRWLLGSVSDRVVHHAHCPVTVVR
jgi:nucleotide-binding universal stress UspA family protein